MKNKQLLMLLFFVGTILPRVMTAQNIPDFLLLLNDSSGTANFLQPKHTGRQFPYHGNEISNRKQLEIATANNDFKGIIYSAENLGFIQIKKGAPAEAIIYFKKSLEASQKSADNISIGVACIQLGIASQQIRDEFHIIEYFTAAISHISRLKLYKVNGFCYAMIAQSYARQKDPTKASEYYSRASKSFLAGNEKTQAAICYNLMGETQLKFNNFSKATGNFNSALELISKKPNEKKLHSDILRNIGLVYFKKGEFEKAIIYFNKSINENSQVLVLKLIKDSYLQLFTIYSFKNDFSKADLYHEKYRTLKDSLDQTEFKRKTIPLSTTETADKQNVIELLQKQMEEQAMQLNQRQLELSQMITKSDIELQTKNQELEVKNRQVKELEEQRIKNERDLARKELLISRQNSFRNLLIAISIGILLMALMLYNRYQLKRKANLRLEKSNIEIADAMDELKNAQERLIQSEKMASLGQLTAGIAHEIQNPLNFVNNFSESSIMMLDEFIVTNDETERQELGQELKDTLVRIRHHGDRADKIVKHMLQHSRSGTAEKELADLNSLCQETVDLAYHGARASLPEFHCTVTKHFTENLPPLLINRQEFSRVLVNLLNNSFYAMNKKIKSGSSSNYQPELNIFTSKEKDLLKITIRDNGIGIPRKIVDKIFNPFFTTKPSGEGTGLGLSMSFDIITKGHGGKLEAESEEGVFTEFRIYLPIVS